MRQLLAKTHRKHLTKTEDEDSWDAKRDLVQIPRQARNETISPKSPPEVWYKSGHERCNERWLEEDGVILD